MAFSHHAHEDSSTGPAPLRRSIFFLSTLSRRNLALRRQPSGLQQLPLHPRRRTGRWRLFGDVFPRPGMGPPQVESKTCRGSRAGRIRVRLHRHAHLSPRQCLGSKRWPSCITIFYAGILILSLGNGLVSGLARMSWLRWFGSISYGLYIVHQLLNPIYSQLATAIAPHVGHSASHAINFVLGTSVSILLAWVSLRFFETPFSNCGQGTNPAPSLSNRGSVKIRPFAAIGVAVLGLAQKRISLSIHGKRVTFPSGLF